MTCSPTLLTLATLATCAPLPLNSLAQTPGSLTEVGAYVTPASLSVATWQGGVLIGTELGLLVQDLTDPANPVTLADLRFGLPVQAITVAGDSALLALPEGEQRLVDLAAGPPWSVAPVPPDFALPNLWIDGAPHFVTSDGGELRIYELTTAGRILRGALALSPYPIRDLQVENARAYALVITTISPDPNWAVRAVDLSNPAAPVVLGNYDPPGTEYTFWISRVRNAICYLVTRRGLLFLDTVSFAQPGSPVLLGSCGVGVIQYPRNLHMGLSGNWAVVGDYSDSYAPPGYTFRVFDVSNPANPRVNVDFANTEAALRDLTLRASLVLCATTEALRVLKIRTPAGTPVEDFGYSHFYCNGSSVAGGGRAAYVIDRNGAPELQTIDLAEPSRPLLARRQPLLSPIYSGIHTGFAVVGEALYVLQGGSYGIGMFDISDPLAPDPRGVWTPPITYATVRIEGACMAGARESGGAVFYDLADPFAPQLMAERTTTRGCRLAWWNGDLAVLALEGLDPPPGSGWRDGIDTLLTLDMSDPRSPAESGRSVWRYDVDGAIVRIPFVGVCDASAGVWSFEKRYAWFDLRGSGGPVQIGPDLADSPIWRTGSFTVLGMQGVISGDSLLVYDLVANPLAPPLLASWSAGAPIRAVSVKDEQVVVHTSGRIDVLRFRSDVIPPAVSLSIVHMPADPSRLLVRLESNEALCPTDIVVTVNQQALAVEGGTTTFVSVIPEEIIGDIHVHARVTDRGGNVVEVDQACAVARYPASGIALCFEALGLRIGAPAGAFPEPVWLLLRSYAGEEDRDTILDLQPENVVPAVPLTLVLPASREAEPRLDWWDGTRWAPVALQLDRASGTARARLGRLGRCRWRTDDEAAVSQTALARAAPNPFNALTNIAFELVTPSRVRMRIHDVRGRTLRELFVGDLPAGRHGLDWDGRDGEGRPLPSGVYFYRLELGGHELTGRCLLVR